MAGIVLTSRSHSIVRRSQVLSQRFHQSKQSDLILLENCRNERERNTKKEVSSWKAREGKEGGVAGKRMKD